MFPDHSESGEAREQSERQELLHLFNQRLKLLLDQDSGLPSQGHGRIEAVASRLGIPVSSAQRLLSGTVMPELHRLARIAERLEVTADFLLGSASLEEARRNIGERRGEAVPVSTQRYLTIPILNPDTHLSEDAYFHVPRVYIARFIQPIESAAMIVMRGDGMEPTIQNGEMLFIALAPYEGREILPEGLYPLRRRGRQDWTVRRLQAVGRDYLVSHDNPRYAPQQISRTALSEDGDYEWVLAGRIRTLLKRY